MKHFTTLTFFFLAIHLFGQNLVVNGSFDEFEQCPEDHSQSQRAIGWNPLLGTPDYFNACDETEFVGTPLNLTHGFQVPLSGDGYAGLIGIAFNNDREILGTELSEPLEVGSEYYVEFYWSRTFGGVFHANCDCASSHLGALFTTEIFDNVENPISYENFAHVFDPTLHADSANWVKVSGWFTADSAYTHLAIGDFFSLDQNETAHYNGSPSEIFLNTYYYIENVCVTQDPADCGILSSTDNLERSDHSLVYPNPTQGHFWIDKSLDIERIRIYNMQGGLEKVVLNPSQYLDISNLPKGVYLLKIETGRSLLNKKIIKTD